MHHAGLIFFIGFMGSGKSFWAEKMSKKLSISFVELDRQIEKKVGLTITEIFAHVGEAAFRQLEKEVLYEYSRNSFDGIVSCGGGTPCYFDNLSWMKQQGTVVFLKASLQTLEHRMASLKGRPLVVQHEFQWTRLEELYHSRLPYYEQADVVIDIDSMDDAIFAEILKPYV